MYMYKGIHETRTGACALVCTYMLFQALPYLLTRSWCHISGVRGGSSCLTRCGGCGGDLCTHV